MVGFIFLVFILIPFVIMTMFDGVSATQALNTTMWMAIALIVCAYVKSMNRRI